MSNGARHVLGVVAGLLLPPLILAGLVYGIAEISRTMAVTFGVSWLGLGVVAAGVSTWAMGLFFADRAKQEGAGAESSGRQVAELIIDGAYDDVTRVALIVGGVGVAMFAVGVLGRLIIGRR